jgi:hypothetical protein
MSRALSVLLTLACLTGAAFAQSAAGTWSGETEGRGGTQTTTLTLAVDGSTLTGTFAQGEQSDPISEGAVDGNMISFQRALEFGGNAVTLNYTGEIDGDTLTLNVTFPGAGPGGAPGGGGGGGRGGRGAQMPIVLMRQ